MPLLLKVVVQDCHINELTIGLAEVNDTLEKMKKAVNDKQETLENAFYMKKAAWEIDHQIMRVTLEKFEMLEDNCSKIGASNHRWIIRLQEQFEKLQKEVEKKTDYTDIRTKEVEKKTDYDIRTYFKDQNDTNENVSEEAGDPPPAYSAQPALK